MPLFIEVETSFYDVANILIYERHENLRMGGMGGGREREGRGCFPRRNVAALQSPSKTNETTRMSQARDFLCSSGEEKTGMIDDGDQ